MKTFKTRKGTELPLISLKGKDYLMVKDRIIWMREEHPDWSIITNIIEHTDEKSIVKTTINEASGVVVATAHKREDRKHFQDHLEKAETGSVGRALALCGYGTQFTADELLEGDRIVDTPVAPKRKEPKTRDGKEPFIKAINIELKRITKDFTEHDTLKHMYEVMGIDSNGDLIKKPVEQLKKYLENLKEL